GAAVFGSAASSSPLSGSSLSCRSSSTRRFVSISRLVCGAPLWSIHALGRSHSVVTCTSEPFLTYCAATSARRFQQFTRSHKVCFLPLPFLRLTATLKLATCCSPTVLICGSLPTKPVT